MTAPPHGPPFLAAGEGRGPVHVFRSPRRVPRSKDGGDAKGTVRTETSRMVAPFRGITHGKGGNVG